MSVVLEQKEKQIEVLKNNAIDKYKRESQINIKSNKSMKCPMM